MSSGEAVSPRSEARGEVKRPVDESLGDRGQSLNDAGRLMPVDDIVELE